MKLKGIELKGTYEVEFDATWFEVYDENDNLIYFENSDGYWFKKEYDEKGNMIYYENSEGSWFKKEYDERSNVIYYGNSDGEFVDNRVKELTVEEIEKLLGYKIKIKGENK